MMSRANVQSGSAPVTRSPDSSGPPGMIAIGPSPKRAPITSATTASSATPIAPASHLRSSHRRPPRLLGHRFAPNYTVDPRVRPPPRSSTSGRAAHGRLFGSGVGASDRPIGLAIRLSPRPKPATVHDPANRQSGRRFDPGNVDTFGEAKSLIGGALSVCCWQRCCLLRHDAPPAVVFHIHGQVAVFALSRRLSRATSTPTPTAKSEQERHAYRDLGRKVEQPQRQGSQGPWHPANEPAEGLSDDALRQTSEASPSGPGRRQPRAAGPLH